LSRYQPLAEFLASRGLPVWDASFAEIETHLGFPLPERAHRNADWWANLSGAGHSQSRGWCNAGWRTCAVDLERKRVRFERASNETSPSEELQAIQRLIAEASALTGIEDRATLVREGLQALVAREAALKLAAP
jgi:hypothetical protein